MPRDADVRDAVVVYLNVSILALPYIDTAQLRFTADFYLNLRWYDLRVNLQVRLLKAFCVCSVGLNGIN